MDIMTNKKDSLKWEKPNKPRQKLSFTVPIPPSQNSAFFGNRRGTKPHAKLWMRMCKAHVLKVIEEAKWSHEGEDVWFYVDMVFYFP
jgi:hypothetical protein